MPSTEWILFSSLDSQQAFSYIQETFSLLQENGGNAGKFTQNKVNFFGDV